MRGPPPKKKKKDSGLCGKTRREFDARLKRFKESIHAIRDIKTGVPEYDEAKLVEEAYVLVLTMYIMTKRGGPWYNAQSPDWPKRSQAAVESMEEIWL
jgi:hypothetical protein